MSHVVKKNARRGRLLICLLVLLVTGAVLVGGGYRATTGPAEGASLSGQAQKTSTKARSFRIGTFNIDGGRGVDGKVDLDRTAKSLQQLDFIGLNEVHGFFGNDLSNQAQAIAGTLHLPYLWVPAERQWWHESFGNAILTNLPTTQWRRVPLPSRPFSASRNYLLTSVTWNGRPIQILTTHTDWKAGGEEQFEIVGKVFMSLPTPAVLMGDLNCPESDAKIRQLMTTPGVEEAIDSVVGPQPKRVDWIFLRGLTTLDAGVVDTGASDHPAYWAQVKLAQPATREQ